MTKPELQKIALTLFNQGFDDFESIGYARPLRNATDKEIKQCCDYIEEIIRAGKSEYVKKYCIK